MHQCSYKIRRLWRAPGTRGRSRPRRTQRRRCRGRCCGRPRCLRTAAAVQCETEPARRGSSQSDGSGSISWIGIRLTVVATDRARGGVARVGLAEQHAADLDGVAALPNHADNGPRGHVLDQRREERLGREVRVVLLQVGLGRRGHLEADELVALGLEAADDGADQPALDAIRLDHDCRTAERRRVSDVPRIAQQADSAAASG